MNWFISKTEAIKKRSLIVINGNSDSLNGNFFKKSVRDLGCKMDENVMNKSRIVIKDQMFLLGPKMVKP